MGIFGGIENHKPTEGGIYFEAGQYVYLMTACKAGETRKKVKFFVVEGLILKSSNPNRPAGSRCSWMVTLDKDAALGNIRGFCAEASDASVEEVDEAAVEAIVSSANPLEGTVIKADATNITTRAGNPFTLVKWQRMDAAEQDAWSKKAAGMSSAA